MDSYQLQAEREIWDAIATQDAPPQRNGHLYRPMVAKHSGRCDSCQSRIAAGKTSIRYSSLAPRGSKVLCFPCFDGGASTEAQDA